MVHRFLSSSCAAHFNAAMQTPAFRPDALVVRQCMQSVVPLPLSRKFCLSSVLISRSVCRIARDLPMSSLRYLLQPKPSRSRMILTKQLTATVSQFKEHLPPDTNRAPFAHLRELLLRCQCDHALLLIVDKCLLQRNHQPSLNPR